MSTQKEIFQENMNALFEAVNAKVGTNGAMTIAEMKTAVENAVVPYKAKVDIDTTSVYTRTTSTTIYKYTLTEDVDGAPSGYKVLFKLTFGNDNWEILGKTFDSTSSWFQIGELTLITSTENLSNDIYVFKKDNVLYFLTQSTIYFSAHGSYLNFYTPILCKSLPTKTLGTYTANGSHTTSSFLTYSSGSSSGYIFILNNIQYNTVIRSIYFTGRASSIGSFSMNSSPITKYL